LSGVSDAPRRGVHQMVFDAISASDADIRKDLYSNIILTGGNSLLPGNTSLYYFLFIILLLLLLEEC
jgi:hypothetical protein